KTVSDASSGIYMIKLMPGVYKVTISADGYIPKTIPFIVPKTGPMIRNFELLKKKAHFILQGIYFDSGSARIRPSSYPILDKVVKTLEEYPDITVEIQGHTDSVGSAENNLRLSFARANAVKAYLVQMGISPSRLIARGYGESMPIAPNTTRAGRARNRRIEFVVIK
ncbi:MAG TPA: flagellar motor protein MotB, partial [Firmicutes bacterium]|nr:flagellar motor protein MotB [Bacillota bacterium]